LINKIGKILVKILVIGVIGGQTIATEHSADFGVRIEGIASVQCDSKGQVNGEEGILIGGMSAEDREMKIICVINTNYSLWDLKFKAANGGILKNAAGVSLTTDNNENGYLTIWIEKAASDEEIKFFSSISKNIIGNVQEGKNIILGGETSQQSVAEILSEKTADQFHIEKAVEAEFTFKAGITGTKVNSLAGDYKETITVTLTPYYGGTGD
jgi:hypothetical protein